MPRGKLPYVLVSLRPAYLEALERRAQSLDMTIAEVAAHLLTVELQNDLKEEDRGRAEAELEIIGIAERVARDIANSGPWDPHLTLKVFDTIEQEHLALYQRAIAGGSQRDLNRRLGRRIREATNAVASTVNDKVIVKDAPRRGSGLISRYTLLEPPQKTLTK